MIKVSGLWVSPIEIESVLLEHPAVAEGAVVGIAVDGLTKIKAFVIIKGDAIRRRRAGEPSSRSTASRASSVSSTRT